MNWIFFQLRSIKCRVTIATLAIFLIGIWSLAFYVSWMLREDMQRALGEQQFSTVSFMAEEINHELSDRLSALGKVASMVSPSLLGNAAALQSFLEDNMLLQDAFNGGILAYRLDGIAAAEVPLPAGRLGANYADVDSLSAALKSGKTAIGRPVMGNKSRDPAFGMTAPIRDAKGKVIGALTGVTSLGKSSFLDIVTDSRVGKTGSYLLIAPQYRMVVADTGKSRMMEVISASTTTHALIDRFMHGNEGPVVAVNSLGVEMLASHKGIPVAGWLMASVLPTKEAFAPIRAMQQRMLIATIFLTMLAGVLTWRMLKWQLSPMLVAMKTLSALSDTGKPLLPLPIARQDEIGQLIGGFNRLLETLTQREEALKESEIRWRFAIEGSGDGLWDWNVAGGTVFFTRRWKEMLGFSEDEIGNRLKEREKCIHPDDKADTLAKVQDCLDGKTRSYISEHRVRCKDGSYKWVLDRGLVVSCSHTGKPLRMIGTHTDITKRKQTEKYEQLRSRILELLAKGEPLSGILETIVQGAEQIAPAVLCSILLVDNEGMRLGIGATPDHPDLDNPAIDGIGVSYSSGGIAAFTEERVVVEETKTYPCSVPRQELAVGAGFRACSSQPIRSSSEQLLGTFSIYHDEACAPAKSDLAIIEQCVGLAGIAIERKLAEGELHLAASVFTHTREGIMITGADGNIINVNDAFTRITGYSRDEVCGRNPRLLGSDRQGREFYAALWRQLTDTGHWQGEIWNRRKSGEVYPELQTISAVRDAQGKTRQYVALFSDITGLKEHERQLEQVAHYDDLTGLPNRGLLADRLHQSMAQTQRCGQRLMVVYLDLDGFKAVNDCHGHAAGDQLLIAVAARMKYALREGDTLARMGGDEFVAVLLDLADVAASAPVLNRLLAAAAQPVQIGDLALQVSASVGVTFYPQAENVDADLLLRQADQAMYQAKLAGKNRYCVFDAEQDRSVRGYNENLERIGRALNEREFVLYYQPKVNMRTGAVVGAEALIRWQHPERGLLPPAMFLPAIEDHPLAVDLGEWVIDTALRQKALWHAAGLDIPVSVNVGARQLQQADFVERLRTQLAAHPNFRPGDLELEVLETSALADLAKVSGVIDNCRQLGVMFSLDDFGTGYSSLTYLKRLPVALLKIDQSFVRGMLDDPHDLAILEGVIGLAAAFRRQVIAEGVETVEHGEMLLQLGCELAQGYGIARPMPAHELPGWSATWRPDPAWVDRSSVNRDDLPLLFASAEHRIWIAAVTSHLKGEREAPPLDHRQCRLGMWLNAKGLTRHGAHPVFQALDLMHRQVHALATELCELQTLGRNPEALARLGELHGLRDNLLAASCGFLGLAA